MADENQPVLDLLGDPWRELKDPRGRKRHKYDPQIAEFVAVSKATGGPEATEEAIAAHVGLSVPTLRKYYFRELANAVTLARQVVIGVMWRKMLDGNVGAAKWIDEKLARGELEDFLRKQQAEPGSDVASAQAPPPRPRGKKEQALIDAHSAAEGTDWGGDLEFPKH